MPGSSHRLHGPTQGAVIWRPTARSSGSPLRNQRDGLHVGPTGLHHLFGAGRVHSGPPNSARTSSSCSASHSSWVIVTCPEPGGVGMLLLESLQNAVQPPGARTHPRVVPGKGERPGSVQVEPGQPPHGMLAAHALDSHAARGALDVMARAAGRGFCTASRGGG